MTPTGAPRSLWWATLPQAAPSRPALAGPATVDVAIVGGGFTGLWAAFHLAAADPGLRILVLEARTVGFGASGRNGGWCSAYFPASLERLAAAGGRPAALRMQEALNRTVSDVGADLAAAGVDCDWHAGGTVTLALNEAQVARAQAAVAHARAWGLGEDHLRWLPRSEARQLIDARGMLGATFGGACAVLHPAKAVAGLAEAVERRGVRIVERTPVREVRQGRVETGATGAVRAEVVIDATEAYRVLRRETRRGVVPVYSLMIATAPLPTSTWAAIGLADRPTVGTWGAGVLYAQRTADDRIALGGRGAPYHLGSRISPRHDHHPRTHARLRRTLVDLLPVAAGAPIDFEWGGPLGVPRDWFPSVGFDRTTGLGWAGGYVGDGVAASHLAGRTLAALICPGAASVDPDLADLPWVGHRSPLWEPEPLRWLGINAGLQLAALGDDYEGRTGRPSPAGGLLDLLTGG